MVTPELSLWGYPPRDLLLSPEHLQQQSEALNQLQQGLSHALPQTALLVGVVEPAPDQQHTTTLQCGGPGGGKRLARCSPQTTPPHL